MGDRPLFKTPFSDRPTATKRNAASPDRRMNPRNRGRIRHAVVVAVTTGAALLAGCDTAPGPESPGFGPVVSDLRYDPPSVVVSELPEGSVSGGMVTVPFSLSVQASDPDGDLADVSWIVRGPDADTAPVASGRLSVQTGGRFGAATQLSLPIAVTGRYTVVVHASDRAGRLGNETRGAIDLLAEGHPPSIGSVDMPDRVARPPAGSPPVVVRIVAAVDDPDGAANVLRVQTVVNGRTTLLLCDDGSQAMCNAGAVSGDQVAGDSRYTLTLQVEATNSPGVNTFEFTAVDRSGLVSAPVVRTIVIE